MKKTRFKFIVDKIHITRPYTITEILMLDEENILESMEVCTCELNESNNHCECEPEFYNSEITGKLQLAYTNPEGKEFYKGDIINFHANYTNKQCGYLTGVIVWDEFSWKIEVGKELYSIEDETDEFYYKARVIGNIYESPELLK